MSKGSSRGQKPLTGQHRRNNWYLDALAKAAGKDWRYGRTFYRCPCGGEDEARYNPPERLDCWNCGRAGTMVKADL